MMTLMPSICFSAKKDSTLLGRIWNYQRNYSQPISGLTQNVYLCYGFKTERRNPTLFLVPTMYVIAKGDRQYVGESYCKVKFQNLDKYDLQRQVVSGTIPRQRTAMPAMLQSITPNFYDDTIYPDYLLSPFHRTNRHRYTYTISDSEGGLAIVSFRPRRPNTHLVSGQAVVDNSTGRLQSVQFTGEFDMTAFKVTALMNMQDLHTPLPERCSTEATFRFMGNHIKAHCTAIYNCTTTLPDSIKGKDDRELMAQLRPIPLTPEDQKIYEEYDEERREEIKEEAADTTAINKKWEWLKNFAWDVIGYNMINSYKTGSGPLTMRMSPLLNPLYLGYSHSQGISYKLNIGLQYAWNKHRYLTLNSRIGYNFKQRQFYYNLPLRMNYNPKRNGYAEIRFANGNHISNATLADDFHKKMGKDVPMPDYKDRYLQVVNNVVAFDWLEIMTGMVYHNRQSVDKSKMEAAGMETSFNSFAPLITLRFTPWSKGPTFTANYERGIKNIFKANLDYERWEYDVVYMRKMKGMRILNLRAGTGYYTQRNSIYFVDFANFHAVNLPTGWEDDWSGQFQLLDSRWYNESSYYLRAHASYDSPLMALSHLPIFGRYIESERIYLSALSIDHTRPYFELGYGLSNRYLSAAVFTNFLGLNIQEVGFKVTIQIFNRW